jgi:NAD(P)-dependent dehydrogenase (short-subunit alcohol dehydrogenase family)
VVAERTVLITGGTSGLGLAAAAELAGDPRWRVLITGRDAQRTSAAAARVGAESELLDLGSLDDVRGFAERMRGGERAPIGALICNAGWQQISGYATSADGYEATFAVNHLGHFLLLALLLDQLSAPARVVLIASDTHDPAQRTGMPEPRYTTAAELAHADSRWAAGEGPVTAGRRRYTTSKLCNVLLTYELDRRLAGRGITFNAFDPGMMPGTGLARDYPALQRLAWRFVLPALTLIRSNVNTPRQSGRALARLVGDPALEGLSGRYFSGAGEIRSSAESYDAAKAADLWQSSLELVGLEEITLEAERG